MSRRAFTLVETLMALSLTAVLAAGCAMLVMEVTQAWSQREITPAFRRHVRGLGGFLEAAVAASAKDPAAARAGRFSVPPGMPAASPPALHLVLRNLGQSLPAPAGSNPDGEGWLLHEPDTGLVMLWRTDREKRLKDGELHRTVISPWCLGIDLLEYDVPRDRWRQISPGESDTARDTRSRVVIRLRRFGEAATLTLNLDPSPADAPAY